MDSAERTAPVPEQDLFTWNAAARPFKERNRQFYVSLFAIVGLVGFVLFIAEGAMPVVLLAAITFLFYVLSTVKPEEITYKITNKGIRVAERLTQWDLLGRFWFINRLGSDVLAVETGMIPGRLELVIRDQDKDEIKKVLSKYLLYEEVKPTRVENMSSWISSKLPGNKI